MYVHLCRTCAMNVYIVIYVRRTCTACMYGVHVRRAFTSFMCDVHVRQCKHSSHMYGIHVHRIFTPYMYDSVKTTLNPTAYAFMVLQHYHNFGTVSKLKCTQVHEDLLVS